jgi:uncharacterized membrane protein YkvI
MNNKKASLTGSMGAAFSMAAVWFATHCGGGFATGNQEVNFYVKYGWYAVFLPIIAMVLLGWSHRNAMVIAKDNKTYDYKSYANALFHPYEKFFALIFELGFLLLILCGVSASIAGAGSLLSTTIGLPYGIGIVLVGFVLLGLTIFGGDLIIKVLKFKTYFLIVALALLTILGLKMGAVNFHQVMATNQTYGGTFWGAVWKMLIYIGFQAFTVLPIISVSHHIKTTKECNMFMLLGTLLNGVFLVAVCIMLLGFSPEVLKQTLPVYFVTTKLGLPWLHILYSLLLFIALLGTAVSLIFSSVARFEKVWDKGTGIFESLRARRIAISVITMAICTGISVFGLTNIVVKGYGSVGYLGLFFVIIPQLVIGTVKIKRAADLRKQQGIDEDAMAA